MRAQAVLKQCLTDAGVDVAPYNFENFQTMLMRIGESRWLTTDRGFCG